MPLDVLEVLRSSDDFLPLLAAEMTASPALDPQRPHTMPARATFKASDQEVTGQEAAQHVSPLQPVEPVQSPLLQPQLQPWQQQHEQQSQLQGQKQPHQRSVQQLHQECLPSSHLQEQQQLQQHQHQHLAQLQHVRHVMPTQAAQLAVQHQAAASLAKDANLPGPMPYAEQHQEPPLLVQSRQRALMQLQSHALTSAVKPEAVLQQQQKQVLPQ
ncbi:MAG: hypothetical protein HETSPECPRED_006343 [Heterodermia speciosa]|uniref:Uncharacterized protein n=1 Tax=Heterodermia speciosa TaxID=116794 RepID=A0A8H3FMF4_9LECA|nr:MAG: hypothetical protein HETSPECPRED_006343 [Heterodermia speciosa]